MGPNEKALREKFDAISQEIAGARALLNWIRTERVNAPMVNILIDEYFAKYNYQSDGEVDGR
jgi:hypothetical protein